MYCWLVPFFRGTTDTHLNMDVSLALRFPCFLTITYKHLLCLEPLSRQTAVRIDDSNYPKLSHILTPPIKISLFRRYKRDPSIVWNEITKANNNLYVSKRDVDALKTILSKCQNSQAQFTSQLISTCNLCISNWS